MYTELGLLCRNNTLTALYCLSVRVHQIAKPAQLGLHVWGTRWLPSQPDKLLHPLQTNTLMHMYSLRNVTGHEATKGLLQNSNDTLLR